MHDALTLNSVTLLIVIALGCGFALMRLRQPAIVGYILAGVVLGPGGLGLIHSAEGIDLFAELGVLLLLFLIGLELNLKAFRSVFRIALLCAGLQSAIAIGLTWGAGSLLGWGFERSLVLGFVLSLSSTAVGIKMLAEIGETRTHAGRLTMGVLIAQDLLIIPMLVVVQSLGSARAGGTEFDILLAVKLFAAVAVLAGVAVILTRRERITLPWSRYLRHQPDLAPLANIAFCFVFAAVSGYIGLSPSYGAFLAGLILGASTDRRAAILFTAPVQSLLLMIFFLSIGLLIDLAFIVENLWVVLFLVFVVLVAKTASNIGILHFLREPWESAFIAGLVMAQIGEFSFVLAKAGVGAGAIDLETYQLALSVIALSLIISPFWLVTARRIHTLGRDFQYTGLGATAQRIYPNAYGLGQRGANAVQRRVDAIYRRLRERGTGKPPGE